MNSKFARLALSFALAVFSLALLITVVSESASGATSLELGIEKEAVMERGSYSRLLADQRPEIRQEESLSPAGRMSLYVPLLETDYIDPAAERAALMALYNSTNGGMWFNSAGWGTDASYCGWYGVFCDVNKHVIILNLEGNALSGTIPPEIGNLPKLITLQLTATIGPGPRQLSDPFPPEVGNLTSLQELGLRFNNFSSLPPEIGHLKNLQKLDLYHNQLASLPQEIGNFANLQELNLAENQVKFLPMEIGKLVSLQKLVLYGNQLKSPPLEIFNLANLQELDLSYTNLTFLPKEIGNLVNLGKLGLGGNHFTSLPPEIGNLVNLRELYLNDNRLSGKIPAFLSNLSNLYSLKLSGNPDLTCWETQAARDWALSLEYYDGPTCYLP